MAGSQPGNLLWANVLILVGDLLNAYAGSSARGGFLTNSFWLVMALGWTAFYTGVILTGRRKVPSAARESQPEGAAQNTATPA